MTRRNMLKEEKKLRAWAECADGDPAYAHPASVPRDFYRDITALVRAVREDDAFIAEELTPYPDEIAAAIRGRE
jgi:hypothetical protein